MSHKFRVRLGQIHNKSGLTQYAVIRDTGINKNTVRRYIRDDEVLVDKIEIPLILLIQFYGLDWHDPAVLDFVEVED